MQRFRIEIQVDQITSEEGYLVWHKSGKFVMPGTFAGDIFTEEEVKKELEKARNVYPYAVAYSL